MKNLLTILILTIMTTTTYSQSLNSKTKNTFSKISEKKEEIVKNNIRYSQSKITVEFDGVENNSYEYSMNSPSGNKLEININDKSDGIKFSIIEGNNDHPDKDKKFNTWSGIYQNSFIIKFEIPQERKKYTFSFVILEGIGRE